jgi:hypothetical protein
MTAEVGGWRLEAGKALVTVLVWLTLTTSAFAQSSHLLIIVGLAGDPEHGELFKKWGTALAETATQKLGLLKENVTLADAGATREEVVKVRREGARGRHGVLTV